MPVSHLGLTVSHIPSATSFYLAALQPLGYQYIGQSGDSIGLGVTEADFFLTQEPRGITVSPAHIAFSANSRLAVRDCYAAALGAGAYPSGAPGFRNGQATAFNAAVEDLDGNVVEFIWRDPVITDEEKVNPEAATAEDSRVLSWQKDVARSGLHDDVESLSSRMSRAKSRAQTALELASQSSRSMRSASEAPAQGIRPVRTEPVVSSNDFPSKAFLGTLIGVAAAGAFAYAMGKTEQENAREEAAYSASRRSKSASRRSLDEPRDAGSHHTYSVTQSRSPRTHRNFSTTESYASRRYPPRSLRTIQPSAYYNDGEVQEAISRYTSSRRPPGPQRSRTLDAIEYTPVSRADQGSRTTAKRSTMDRSTNGAPEDVPQSNTDRSSRHSAKHSSTLPVDHSNRYIEAPPKSATSRHSRHRSSFDDADLKRRDSGISMHSHRSRHTAKESSRRSSTSTVKPSKRSGSLSHHDIAADIPLPASNAASYVSAAQVPIPESTADRGLTDGDDSDGLGDMKTVVPDDSISCIDFSKPQRHTSKSGRSKSSRLGNSSRRSESASERTVKPAPKAAGSRQSAMTLPVRPKEKYDDLRGSRKGGNGKRSAVSYA